MLSYLKAWIFERTSLAPLIILVLHRRIFAATCTSVNVSGVGELDGTYTWEYPGEYTASATTPENLYVRVDNGTFELRGYGWIWYLVEDEASRYRVSHAEDG